MIAVNHYKITARKKKQLKKKYSFTLFLLNPLSFCISCSQHIDSVKPSEKKIKIRSIVT